jgi:hypothetical protein
MKKCECIGCSSIATKKVKEMETGKIVSVCKKHTNTINQMSKRVYQPPK